MRDTRPVDMERWTSIEFRDPRCVQDRDLLVLGCELALRYGSVTRVAGDSF